MGEGKAPKMQRALMIVFAAMALAACGSEPASEPLVAPPELADAFIEGAKAQPASDTPIADPYRRADASFSKFPLESEIARTKVGQLVNERECDDDLIPCLWKDDKGVNHIFGGKLLAIKVINLQPGDNRPISALGIGTALSRGDVVANVKRFLPEIAVDCLNAEEAGEGEGLSSCGGSFEGNSWFKLIFDPNDQLVSARIDAFQIN